MEYIVNSAGVPIPKKDYLAALEKNNVKTAKKSSQPEELTVKGK